MKKGAWIKGVQALLALSSLALSNAVCAITVAGHDLSDTWKHGKETLILNGAGVREYGLLKIRVYVAALYVEALEAQTESNAESNNEHKAERVLADDRPRVIHMKMVRAVSRDDSVKAWQYYLEKNCLAPCVLNADALKQFLVLVSEAKKGDTQTYTFSDQKLVIAKNGQTIGEIKDPNFARTVLATWIGRVPTTDALKRDLLGAN